MAIKEKLEKLAGERDTPCVTISLETHRTHPENAKDRVTLKNLLKEARERVLEEFNKREVAPLLENLDSALDEIDVNYNLDSLHLFLSNRTSEMIRSPWPVPENTIHIADSFAIRPLIKALNRSEEYLILLLSQSGVHLYEAINDGVTAEVRNDDFPFSETRHYITHSDKASDPKQIDNKIREFFNRVDKAVVRVHADTDLQCVAICTSDNYSHLLHVADKPGIYHGHVAVNYNNVAPHYLAEQSWKLIQSIQQKRRSEAVEEMQQAVSNGKVLTDLQEIYQASLDGRGDLLIVYPEYTQPVILKDDRTFERVSDPNTPGAVDDIVSTIAWKVLSQNGRVVFTEQSSMDNLGKIALKTRY